MLGSIFAISQALLAAFSLTLVRKELEKANFLSVSLVVTIVGTGIFVPLALLLSPLHSVRVEGVILFLLAGFLWPAFARLLYFRGMEKVGASTSASVFASNPLFSFLIVSVVLTERATIGDLAGTVCVVFGAVVIQQSVQGGESSSKNRKGLLYPLSAAVLTGLAYTIKKQGLGFCDAPFLGVANGYTTLCLYLSVLTLLPKARASKLLNKQSFKLFWKSGLGLCIGHLLSFYALSYGNVSTVVPLMQTEPLFIFLFIHFLCKGTERISIKLIIGAITIIMGVALLTII